MNEDFNNQLNEVFSLPEARGPIPIDWEELYGQRANLGSSDDLVELRSITKDEWDSVVSSNPIVNKYKEVLGYVNFRELQQLINTEAQKRKFDAQRRESEPETPFQSFQSPDIGERLPYKD